MIIIQQLKLLDRHAVSIITEMVLRVMVEIAQNNIHLF